MMAASSSNHRPTAARATTALLVFAAALCLGVIARHNLRGDISAQPIRSSTKSSSKNYELLDTTRPLARLHTNNVAKQTSNNGDNDNNEYFVFLQKFPLENTWQMIFHTEVVVCPRSTFDDSQDFLSTLDQLVNTLSPTNNNNSDDTSKGAPFVSVPEEQWALQSNPNCIQLGYGGASCPSNCCGSPHGNKNTNYALNSRQAVIGNAMGEAKELFLYGISDGVSGLDAYRAVCGGNTDDTTATNHDDAMPKCVSHWAGTDYNPLTNNCNTFTSTILKCVYGLSDAKPDLGISDLVTVECPMEKRGSDGMDVPMCLIPDVPTTSLSDEMDMKKLE